jgi:enamine deaminase RidA (YjgF/YER057c/UK114 family)
MASALFPLIQSRTMRGGRYAVAPVGALPRVFAANEATRRGSFDEELDESVRNLAAMLDVEGLHGRLVTLTASVADPSQSDRCRRGLRAAFGDEGPALTVVAQPPCSGAQVVLEAMAVGEAHGVEAVFERPDDDLVIVRQGGVAWIHAGDPEARTDDPRVHTRTWDRLARLETRLSRVGIGFDQVVRTWFYLGDIVGPEAGIHRYLHLNQSRSEFFADIRFGHGRLVPSFEGPFYPASTGIGMGGSDLAVSALALDGDPGRFMLVPLENPNQTPAFAYAARYSPSSPKFSRALAVSLGSHALILVSGTASITDSETRWIGDVERQTVQTLDNIAALIGEPNLARHGLPGLGATLSDLPSARVYVKHQKDFDTVRAVCEARLGDVPIVYVQADVCRPDLLVEIEAVGVSAL